MFTGSLRICECRMGAGLMADLILIVPILTVIRYAIASSLLEHIKKVIITRHAGFMEYCQSKCLLLTHSSNYLYQLGW
jgi:hypothetical protein